MTRLVSTAWAATCLRLKLAFAGRATRGVKDVCLRAMVDCMVNVGLMQNSHRNAR